MLTDDELAAIAARADRATPGPWRTEHGMVFFARMCDPEDNRYGSYAAPYAIAVEGAFMPVAGYLPADEARPTAYFIASAREDVPALVAEVRRLRDEVAGLRVGTVPPGGIARLLSSRQVVAPPRGSDETALRERGNARPTRAV